MTTIMEWSYYRGSFCQEVPVNMKFWPILAFQFQLLPMSLGSRISFAFSQYNLKIIEVTVLNLCI